MHLWMRCWEFKLPQWRKKLFSSIEVAIKLKTCMIREARKKDKCSSQQEFLSGRLCCLQLDHVRKRMLHSLANELSEQELRKMATVALFWVRTQRTHERRIQNSVMRFAGKPTKIQRNLCLNKLHLELSTFPCPSLYLLNCQITASFAVNDMVWHQIQCLMQRIFQSFANDIHKRANGQKSAKKTSTIGLSRGKG